MLSVKNTVKEMRSVFDGNISRLNIGEEKSVISSIYQQSPQKPKTKENKN